MKLEMRMVSMDFITPFETSFGRQNERNALIFRLENDGITSYSECVTDTDPFYSYEDNETSAHIIKNYLSEKIKGLPDPKEFMESVSFVKGHNMAKAALEMLLWDYHAREQKKPLHELLGKSKGYADVGISIGMDRVEKVQERALKAKNEGYRRVKIKIKKGREIDLVSAVRKTLGDFPLSVDANTDYRIEDMDILEGLDRYNLVYMEQPFEHSDIIDHAKLAGKIKTPICLDESITSAEDARKAISMKACSVINIKPGRVGGLSESMKIAELCKRNGCHVWVGGMLETGIGRGYNVSLASSSLVDFPGDTSPNSHYYHRDVVKNPFMMKEGRITPNSGPGTGVEIDRDFLGQVTKWSLDLI